MFLGDSLTESSTVVLTEGEIDCLSVIAAGTGYGAASVPDGAQLEKPGEGKIIPDQDKAFDWLWDGPDLIEGLKDADQIILATDADDKGRVLRDELAVRLGRDRCYRVKYPDGCKDANEVLMRDGLDALRNVIDGAMPLVPNRLVKPSEIEDDDHVLSYELGLGDFDKHLKIKAPELMIISGPPGHGKSQGALCICGRLAKQGLKCAYLQFEDNPQRSKFDLSSFALEHTKHSNRASAMNWVDDYFRFICPAESEGSVDLDMNWIEGAIKEAVTRHGCKVVCIDPWNEVEHKLDRNETQAMYLNRSLRSLKRISRRYRIVLMVVAHPDKAAGLNNKSIDDWDLYSIDGGAAWNNKADHGLIIFRNPDQSKITESFWKVSKSKDWLRLGEPGTVLMNFKRAIADYEPVSGPVVKINQYVD